MCINPVDFDFREHNFFVRELSYYGVHPSQVDRCGDFSVHVPNEYTH